MVTCAGEMGKPTTGAAAGWVSALLMIFPLALVLPASALAQALNLSGGEGKGSLTVDAEDGIEWNQKEQIFIARGNARAVRGEMTIRSDELRAYYRDTGAGNTDVWRMDAEGNVVMSSPGETAYGGYATYDVARAILILKPDSAPSARARLVAGDETISASGQLEFWENRNISVARGGAQAAQPDRTLFAEVLVAHLARKQDGSDRVERIEAYDNVKIVTPEDTVTSQRGTYQVETGIATMVGSVRMQRGTNTLEGCRAVVDTRRGISQLFSCKGADGEDVRVKGQLVPRVIIPEKVP